MKNIHSLDQFVRVALGLACIELAVFWLAGGPRIAAAALGVLLVLTALARFCPLYRIAGIGSLRAGGADWRKGARLLGAAVVLLVAAGGAYGSMFLTRKLFMEDFNAMNHLYKQTLFLTGKNERAPALANYDRLLPAYQAFQTKYSRYQPFALQGDRQLAGDLARVAGMLVQVGPTVRDGDLHLAHLALEQVRPVFQDIFKRNGFSLLAVTLVDFHDAMELLLDAANARDAAKVLALYPQVSDKLKAVEAEANDAQIQAIRNSLDDVFAAAGSASTAALAAKADVLKASFVKVYLQRG